MPLPLCPTDPNSFANTHQAAVRHSHLVLAADFGAKVFRGAVEHTVRIVAPTDHVVFDSSFIDVHGVTLAGANLEFAVAPRSEPFGSPLTVRFGRVAAAGEELVVRIAYSTTAKCTAVQWLEPAQTVGKKHPYLFSQCQDTPGVKHTYSAEITVSEQLRALMSAVPAGEAPGAASGTKLFKFEQKIAIPSYLIAIAVGNIHGKRVGPRSTVWSEPEVVEAAAWEFADTETFIKTGEDLLTPYVWGVYDLLLLPASFPFGGMENPCLTFVTPTLLAGDRSLVDVVAHEIAHSWMGNLVTTQSWEHFWLNEGFTVFIERKILGRLHGEATRHFDAIIGFGELKDAVERYEQTGHPEYSCLCPKMDGQDPDDTFSSVPYEKGFNFLFYLEKLVGGPAVFEPYLKAHVERFSHKSITTADFKAFMFEYFEKIDGGSKIPQLKSVDWDSWFYKPGMPVVLNEFDPSLARSCEDLANRWDAARNETSPKFNKDEFAAFDSAQKVMFLEKLSQKPTFTVSTLEAMDRIYDLTSITNCEVRLRWQLLCLQSGMESIFPHVTAFASSVGRMKYVRPLYRELYKCKNGAELAKKTFLEHRSFYHPICASMVAKDLGLAA
ncbi:Leucyl aminopeptidase yscIV [Polyrhizophydium stewartii]|uniref:Leucyl aminopeptidase yscIV n=1 Tax=Polyrhizophydium stewartii TaxID=2732419 RepID=A0ABR4MZS1_9FUNG|nr:Leukotriene A-4 hydrolase [Polyrhizophydium stewartii]